MPAQLTGDSGLAVSILMHVEHTDDDILAPEQKHERKYFPAKQENACNRDEIGEHERDDGGPQPVGGGGFPKEFHRIHKGELSATH